MVHIYYGPVADKSRIYDKRHITISNRYNTHSKLNKRSEDTQFAWTTQWGDDFELVDAYHKRELGNPTNSEMVDGTMSSPVEQASNYLVGAFAMIIIIIGFTIITVVISILCQRWYEKQQSKMRGSTSHKVNKERKAKADKWRPSSRNPLKIEVKISEKTERDDDTIVVPSPTFPPILDRYSFNTTHSSLSEATRYSRMESFWALNENGSSMSLRIPPRTQSRNALDLPLEMAEFQHIPNSLDLGWSGLSPPNGTGLEGGLSLSPARSWLCEDAFNDEYHDLVELSQIKTEQDFKDTPEHVQGKCMNRSTFGACMNSTLSTNGNDRKSIGMNF